MTPGRSSTRFCFAPSSTLSVVSGTTTVCPCEKGAGCETPKSVLTVMLRLPWAMAIGMMCTSLPMITVPVRSFRMTRAAVSGITSTCSMAVAVATASASEAAPRSTATVPASSGRAAARPSASFTAVATRPAVVKSGWWSARVSTPSAPSVTGTSRSTSAPPARKAAVGWLFCAEAPAACVENPPPSETGPWATA